MDIDNTHTHRHKIFCNLQLYRILFVTLNTVYVINYNIAALNWRRKNAFIECHTVDDSDCCRSSHSSSAPLLPSLSPVLFSVSLLLRLFPARFRNERNKKHRKKWLWWKLPITQYLRPKRKQLFVDYYFFLCRCCWNDVCSTMCVLCVFYQVDHRNLFKVYKAIISLGEK